VGEQPGRCEQPTRAPPATTHRRHPATFPVGTAFLADPVAALQPCPERSSVRRRRHSRQQSLKAVPQRDCESVPLVLWQQLDARLFKDKGADCVGAPPMVSCNTQEGPVRLEATRRGSGAQQQSRAHPQAPTCLADCSRERLQGRRTYTAPASLPVHNILVVTLTYMHNSP
jgi:hypothetical protein